MDLILNLLWWTWRVLFVGLFLLTATHHVIGLRRRYVYFLLRLFEFGHGRIERKKRRIRPSLSEESLDSPGLGGSSNNGLRLSHDNPSALRSSGIEGASFFGDTMGYMSAGIVAIVDDSLLKNFESEELPYWNLLSRNNDRAYEFVSLRLTICWVTGFLVRYLVLLPVRLLILFIGVFGFWATMAFIGIFPAGSLKKRMYEKASMFCFDFIAGCMSLVATFHDRENAPKSGIAVANHTSPIDSMILATDNCYDMVGQRHRGFLGIFMSGLSRASTHIWFDRTNAHDRSGVLTKMKEHSSNPDLPPILIYPEGVCVNNTSVVQFKKGAFEIDSVIHPIAIRFDPRLGNPFWWQDSFIPYILHTLTSWAIVCDIWYLPPVCRREGESSSQFADRVKSMIAERGGFVVLPWDGFLKSNPVKLEWKRRQQEAYARFLLGVGSEEEEEEEDLESKINGPLCLKENGVILSSLNLSIKKND